ncbi:ParB N-terminal domain-containing protein [Actinokineospora sp. UTMC 2448]|uniref:ParB/RepB/Spo0J family partition protein n=1 Tax=Actinokineospora sp. UTMC 2448 TaxID=2268449 RepID=UPI002164E954|nr:ParB N-terminal domain-containing protein [Actinokineospora sp. UTMC 2448]UVS80595.1 plasmid partitioning protein [Actinokineospora sp. UTMC 2448]
MGTSIWENATLRMVDPTDLLLDQNARSIGDVTADNPELAASVREHGVLVPVIANPTGDGRIRVRDGHSRTLAARLVVDEHPTIPVLVTESTDEEQWRRLRDQWISNEVRTGFSVGDKARLLEQMALFGLSEEEIAAQLTTDVETVKAGLAVGRSRRATEAVATHPQLDMMQAAALAEFEDDPEASESLSWVLQWRPAQYDHTVTLLRRRKAERQACEAKAEELRRAGVTVLEGAAAEGAVQLDRLLRGGKSHTALSEQNHARCPGHAAIVTTNYTGDVTAQYVCRDWKVNGHVQRHPTQEGPRTEEEKAELRRVRHNNEVWRAARDERRAFLTRFLSRKTPPKQLTFALLMALLHGGPHLTAALGRSSGFIAGLLGMEPIQRHGQPNPIVAKAKRAGLNQLTMLLTAVVLGGMEMAYDSRDSVNTWRRPSDEDKLYFATLRDLGYTLSTVESLVLDPMADADQWPHLTTENVA